MRKLIVKYLTSSYRVAIAAKYITFPRAANVVVPVMLLLALAALKNKSYPALDITTWVTLLINITLWAIIVIYNYRYPARWEELDKMQKWIRGSKLSEYKKTERQQSEWQRINNELSSKRYYNILALVVIPLSFLIFGLLVA